MTSSAELSGARAVPRARLIVLALALSAGFALLSWRLYSIQVVGHQVYLSSAANMHTDTEVVHGYRGDIFSRDGVLLARDIVNYEIAIDPTLIGAAHLHRVIRDVCELLGAAVDFRRERLALALEKKAAGTRWLALGKRVDETTKRSIQAALREYLDASEMEGLIARSYTRRTYPRGPFMSPVLGATNHAGRGSEGLERAMESYLASRDGLREVQVGGRTRGKLRAYRIHNAYVAPVSGYAVHCTIDSRVQAIVEAELEWGMRRSRAQAGSCIVMDCRNGDILALASQPAYDPGRFHDYPAEERARRRKNRVVESLYEPGSLAKPFLMAAVLEAGIAQLERPIRSYLPAGVTWEGGSTARFGSRVVRDDHPYPQLTVGDALVQSSNIGMSVLGLRLGQHRIADTLDRFGLSGRTGVRLPAEAKGFYPPRATWKRFYDTVSVSFGYAFMVTPIQLARGFAALVNGGVLLKPRIIEAIARDGVTTPMAGREVIHRSISEATSRRIRRLLRDVVEVGTGKHLKIEGFAFGGKTGTARMVAGRRYSDSDYLASFEGFYPVDDPQVVILCMIERPRGASYYGSMVSGPVVVEVLRRMYGVEAECALAKLAPGQWKGAVEEPVN